jgi:ribosomal protein S12
MIQESRQDRKICMMKVTTLYKKPRRVLRILKVIRFKNA